MPKRSNDFQELVASFHRMFAPEGAVVTESKMLKGLDGEEREIDVLIEFTEPAYSFRVAVEAKDLSRNLDVMQVEQYIGKYNGPGGLQVDKVIIVAKGFTEGAQKRASNAGIQLHTAKTIHNVGQGTIFVKPPQPPAASSESVRNGDKITCTWIDGNDEPIARTTLQSSQLAHDHPGVCAHRVSCSINHAVDRFARDVKEARQKHRGVMLGGRLQIVFGHVWLQGSESRIPLKRMVVEIAPSMVLPDMDAKEFTVISEEVGEKGLVVAEFKSEVTRFKIAYPKNSDGSLPKAMQLQEFQWSPQFLSGNARIGGPIKPSGKGNTIAEGECDDV